MFSIFARPALYALFLCLYLGCLEFFLPDANACQPPPQSRIEDRVNQPETTKKKAPKVPKRIVWNLDGGAFFDIDGHLQNGSCFRFSGGVTAPDFFDGLRRVDTDDGSAYFRHDQPVTEFPGELLVTVHLRDSPCSNDLKDTAVRPPLTPEIISALRLHFYWKDGIALRPVEGSKRTTASVTRLMPFAKQAEDELAPRFQWNYTFTIQSAGVPLTNDLVLIIENEDHKIAARTHARL
jgi:hypothetical protein